MKRDITEADLIDYLKTILDVEGEITLTEFKSVNVNEYLSQVLANI